MGTKLGSKCHQFQAIKEYHEEVGLSISLLCQLLQVSRSGYYDWLDREPALLERENEWLMAEIQWAFALYNGIFGYRRVTIHINRYHQTHYSEKRIRRLMVLLGLKSHIRRAKGYSTQASYRNLEPNLLNQDFSAERRNEKWVTDVTHLFYGQSQKAYLSVIKDLYDGSIIAFQISQRNDTALVMDTFHQAVQANPHAMPLIHSDRGSAYTSGAYRQLTTEYGFTRSMSRTAQVLDNASMESFFGHFKCECYHLKHFPTYDALETAIEAYMSFYNERRFQSKLNNLTPLEFRYQAAA